MSVVRAHVGPVLAAVDLDRTLIYSRAAWALPEGVAPEVVCVEHYGGAPLSFTTARAASSLVELAREAALLPATTRTCEQLARVALPWVGPAASTHRPGYAIAANGGILLVDGEPDAEWSRQVAGELAASSVPLVEVSEYLEQVFSPAWTLSRRVAEGLFCYAVVDRAALPSGFITELAAWAVERGWELSMQGRKVYLVPAGLTKHAAVAEVARRVGASLVLAAGDSLLDAGMLEGSDAGIRPPHGELATAGFTRPHVVVASRAGVLGGEDVVDWLLARTREALLGAAPATKGRDGGLDVDPAVPA